MYDNGWRAYRAGRGSRVGRRGIDGSRLSCLCTVASSVGSAEGQRVSLRPLSDRRTRLRVEKDVGVIRWVLRLNEAIEFRVLGRLLAEERVPLNWRVLCEIL